MAKVRVTENDQKCEIIINCNLIETDEPLQIVKPKPKKAKVIKLKR